MYCNIHASYSCICALYQQLGQQQMHNQMNALYGHNLSGGSSAITTTSGPSVGSITDTKKEKPNKLLLLLRK